MPHNNCTISVKVFGSTRSRAGIAAIEEAIFAGVPVNVTLLFSREHYVAAAEAYCAASRGALPQVWIRRSVPWFRFSSVDGTWPSSTRFKVNSATTVLPSPCAPTILPRFAGIKVLAEIGCVRSPTQRLPWASTSTKDPAASDTLYVEALAAPDTINTIPEKTLIAIGEHDKVKNELPDDEGNAEMVEAVIAEFTRACINDEPLAASLQREGTVSFAKSWRDLIACIASKSATLVLRY